ncbi:hypothetical protein [Pyramidobacter sp.]|uniref:hypothetical protein n=1 Tax=Pyramidobacter sp. TaxID=1943581 RepID=UPI003317491F
MAAIGVHNFPYGEPKSGSRQNAALICDQQICSIIGARKRTYFFMNFFIKYISGLLIRKNSSDKIKTTYLVYRFNEAESRVLVMGGTARCEAENVDEEE